MVANARCGSRAPAGRSADRWAPGLCLSETSRGFQPELRTRQQPSDSHAVARSKRFTQPSPGFWLGSWAKRAEQAHQLSSCGRFALLLVGF